MSRSCAWFNAEAPHASRKTDSAAKSIVPGVPAGASRQPAAAEHAAKKDRPARESIVKVSSNLI
jgi:hypothetical protein